MQISATPATLIYNAHLFEKDNYQGKQKFRFRPWEERKFLFE